MPQFSFYRLYNLLNEYGESLIQTLTKKFIEEVPTLTPASLPFNNILK